MTAKSWSCSSVSVGAGAFELEITCQDSAENGIAYISGLRAGIIPAPSHHRQGTAKAVAVYSAKFLRVCPISPMSSPNTVTK